MLDLDFEISQPSQTMGTDDQLGQCPLLLLIELLD